MKSCGYKKLNQFKQRIKNKDEALSTWEDETLFLQVSHKN